MRIVHIKIVSDSPLQLYSKIKCTNIVWFILILEQIMSITLEILEAAKPPTSVNSLVLMNRGLTILTEGFLILCQWRYILFFLRKKIEKDELADSKDRMTTTTKVLFGWIIIVLLMNSLNFIGYNIVEAMIEVKSLKDDRLT